MFYRFAAYNSPTFYGWTQFPAVAAAELAHLNKGREINVYSVEEMGTDETVDPALAHAVAHDDMCINDDTRLDDYADGAASE